MGNSASASASRHGRLSERDAWAIATAWHPQIGSVMGLRGAFPVAEPSPVGGPKVRMRPVLLRPSLDITTSIEYVEFVFTWIPPSRLEHVVCAARAATLAWFALACCPGYGGDENPEFWWRVLLATSASSSKNPGSATEATSSSIHLSSSHKFFPSAPRPFPSVRVVPPHGRENATLQFFLFGAATTARHRAPRTDKKLMAVMHTLSPFICDTRWSRELPVAVSSSELGTIAELLAAISKRSSYRTGIPSSVKPLCISEVHSVSEDTVHQCEIDTLLDAEPSVGICFSDSMDRQSVIRHENRPTKGAAGNLGEGKSRVRIETLDLCSKSLRSGQTSTATLQSWCSLLPHTSAVQCVSVTVPRGETLRTDSNAAWLGYAIFHPDMGLDGSSSFTELTLYLGSASQSVLPILKLMAQGNNLLVAMGAAKIVSTEYHQARLRIGTRVWSSRAEADSEGRDLGGATALMTAKHVEPWLTVCFEDPSEAYLLPTDGSLRVVVPGVGIGWVHASHILEVRARLPSVSRVRRLRLFRYVGVDQFFHHDPAAGTDVIGVLSLLGDRLLLLELNGTGPVPARDLQGVLQCCPNVKSLRVQHGGSCWSDASSVLLSDLPRLEELELIVNGTLQPLRAPQLASLRVLRVVRASPGTFRANREAFVSALELCPDLQSVVWLAAPAAPITNLNETLQLLAGIVQPGVHDVARVPFKVAARVAFLSVVSRFAVKQPQHPLGQMDDPDIASHIFSFSSSFMPRKFHINDRA